MERKFYKYEGTGNDFVMIDNRSAWFDAKDNKLIAGLCHRRTGIGADGLILLENDTQSDFGMLYFNADGFEGSMCGNGGRCIIAFAHFLQVFDGTTCTFMAYDGLHEGKLRSDGLIELKMSDVANVQHWQNEDFYVLDTGSPHVVCNVRNLANIDVYAQGKKIRNAVPFAKKGINVNFVEETNDKHLRVRTYERGVEDVTLACGTGVTAATIAYLEKNTVIAGNYTVYCTVDGGELQVNLTKNEKGYTNIFLIGPARQSFRGEF
ncbi:MAG: diaminopimelate epimerase [Chitinophagales bacterium]|nr:diaminopimelate epimerase [Bacteroidota bacterium]MCB9043848.1 diaminopimelate epimerase [Chitinophagales bacterium]